MLLGVAFLAVLIATGIFNYDNAIPSFGEHVSIERAPAGLPLNATDITYLIGYRGIVTYEFTIDESSFREWMNDRRRDRTPLREITASQTLPSFHNIKNTKPLATSQEISNGLQYYWSYTDQAVSGLYDRNTNRAYYHYQSY
jgi:hypothetical protein